MKAKYALLTAAIAVILIGCKPQSDSGTGGSTPTPSETPAAPTPPPTPAPPATNAPAPQP